MTSLRLGSRGSRLALSQSEWVSHLLSQHVPALTVEIVRIQTSGDAIQDVPLGPELGQAFFTKEIEDALIRGGIDLAVHSCKDLATRMPDGLRLAAVPTREDPRDVLVSRGGRLADLPAGSRVGTSSPRRRGFLKFARPDLALQHQRGNVPTRVRAVEEGTADAVVLAAAGLRRLGMGEQITELLDPDIMLPAAAQGALAVQIREDDDATAELVAHLDDPNARSEVTAERGCLRRLEAGCQAPVGALASVRDGAVFLDAAVVTADGIVRAEGSGASRDADSVGIKVAEALLDRLGMPSLRDAPWAGPPPRMRGSQA